VSTLLDALRQLEARGPGRAESPAAILPAEPQAAPEAEAVVPAKPQAARGGVATPAERRIAASILAPLRDDASGVLAFLPVGPGVSALPLLERLAAALAERVEGDMLVLDARGNGLAPADPAGWPERLESLRRQYAWLLVAGGSADEPGTAELARCCDGVYLLVALGSAKRQAVVEAAEVVRTAPGRLLGCLAVGAQD
jgi:hypothetical protein